MQVSTIHQDYNNINSGNAGGTCLTKSKRTIAHGCKMLEKLIIFNGSIVLRNYFLKFTFFMFYKYYFINISIICI